MLVRAVLAACLATLVPATAKAEFELAIYGGANTANDSDVWLTQGALSGSFNVDWFGDSFNKPPYYGVRGTYWLSGSDVPQWGVAIDVTHAKVKSDLGDPAVGATFSKLEFTNGLNSATLNALYRAALNELLTLYAGAGAGVSFPHVEVETIPSAGRTLEYQATGPVVEALVGASVLLTHGLSVFSEYKASYSWHDADLVGGGSLRTNILAHHFAAGLSVSFGGPPSR